MNSVIGALRVILGLDTAQFDKGLTASEKRLERYGRSMQSLGDRIGGLGSSLTLGVTAPVLAAGAAMTKVALDAEEMESAFNVSFGRMAGSAKDWAEQTGDSLKRSTTEMQSAMLTFHGLFKAGGPATEQTRQLSQQFAQLAQDLSSFHNVSPEDALDRLRAGLSGEAEPLRRFNVYLNETAVRAEAVRLGIGKMKGEISESAKIQARASLIMRGTLEAQGDVVRTMDSGSNKIRASQAAWQELSVTIGTKLLPAITPLIDKVTSLIEAFAALPEPVQTGVLGLLAVGAAMGPLMMGVGGVIGAIARVGPALAGTQRYMLGAAAAARGLSVANATAAFTTTAFAASLARGSTPMALLRGAGAATSTVMLGLGRTVVALAGGPFGLLVGSVALATTGFVWLARKTSDAGIAADSANKAHARLDPIILQVKNSLALAAGAAGEARKKYMEAAQAAFILGEREIEAARKSVAAARARVAASKQTDQDLMKSGIGGMPGYETGIRELQAKRAEAELKAAEDLLIEAGIGRRRGSRGKGTTFTIIDPEDALKQQIAADSLATSVTNLGEATDKTAKAAQAADQAFRREQQRLTTQLEAARIAGDLDQVRSLETQIERRSRIHDYQEQGLTLAAATAAAERDIAVLADAKAKAQAAALAERGDELALQLAQITGDEQAVQLLERKAEKQRLIVFYQEQGKSLTDAQAAAEADLAKIEAARLVTRQRLRAEAQAEFDLELARARGDTDAEIRRLEQARDVDRRTREIMTRDGVGESEARRQAEAQVEALEDGRVQGVWRDTFKGAFRAALEGDFKGWFKSWFAERVAKGMEEGLNTIADLLMKIFKQAMSQAGPATAPGGGILNIVGSIFGGGGGFGGFGGPAAASAHMAIPGFKTGGSFKVGGSGGQDSQQMQFMATPGEMVDIRHGPANDNAGPVLRDLGRTFGAIVERLSRIAAGAQRTVSPGAVSMIDAPARAMHRPPAIDAGVSAAANEDRRRGGPVFDLSGAVITQDLLDQMNRMVAEGDAEVLGTVAEAQRRRDQQARYRVGR